MTTDNLPHYNNKPVDVIFPQIRVSVFLPRMKTLQHITDTFNQRVVTAPSTHPAPLAVLITCYIYVQQQSHPSS